jgi:hypothetical protein
MCEREKLEKKKTREMWEREKKKSDKNMWWGGER